MAELPADDVELLDYKLDNGEWSHFPLLRCRNIYILPGVPHLLRQKWGVIRDLLLSGSAGMRPSSPFGSCMFRLSLFDETLIAPCLDTLARKYGPGVAIGSYPVTGQRDGAGILITLDCKQPDVLSAAVDALRQLLPVNSIKSEEQDAASLLISEQQPEGGEDGKFE